MTIDIGQFAGKVTLLDGSWGVQLQNLGLQAGACCELWNLQHPEKVQQVASSYVQAGSEIILTNTFQANRFALARHGLEDKLEQINRQGVEFSRSAAQDGALVFASIGPSGKLLMLDQVSEAELLDAFGAQACGLAAGGADAIVIETMADLDELRLAITAVRQNTNLPVVACMTFDSGPDNTRTMMGVTVSQAIETAQAAGAFAVGANCGMGVANYVQVAQLFTQNTDLPIWIKPNAGLPQQQGDRVVYKQTPEDFAQDAKRIIDLGVSFIGGCCGTGPEHIAQLRQLISNS